MPIYLPAPEHNPSGPDGQGWNRMAIHGMCGDECALRPKSLPAFLDSQDTRRARYGLYGSCTTGGNCAECSTFENTTPWPWMTDTVCIREVDGRPHVMNRQEGGFSERSIQTSWESLLATKHASAKMFRDEHGAGVILTRSHLTANRKDNQ
jgi:hypothetical protein